MPSHLGKGLQFKGELTSTEDLLVEGTLSGKVSAPEHTLTIAREANVDINAFARCIVVVGTAKGTLVASDKIEILNSAMVNAEIVTPRLLLEEGAVICGSIDTRRAEAAVAVARYRQDKGSPVKSR